MPTGGLTLAQALARRAVAMRRAEVLAVDIANKTATLDLDDEAPISNVPYLLEPAVTDIVHVLSQGGALLVLGVTGAAGGSGGGTSRQEIWWSPTAPENPLPGDVWIDSDAGVTVGSDVYFLARVFDGSQWEKIGEPPASDSPASPGDGRWIWNDSTIVSQPPDGEIKANTPQLASATSLSIAKVTADGHVAQGYGMAPGDLFYVTGPEQFGVLFEITALAVNATWFELDVRALHGRDGDPTAGSDAYASWTPVGSIPPHDHDADYLSPDEVLAGTGIAVDSTTTPGAVIISTATGGNAAQGQWKWMSATSGIPAVGYMRFNNADPMLATTLTIADIDANGVDFGWAFVGLLPGDEIMFTDPAAGEFWRGYVDGPVVDQAGRATIPIVAIVNQGTLVQDELINVKAYLGSAESLDHGALGGLGDNDHPQYALATDPGLDEVYYQPAAPANPGKATVWVDSDGLTQAPPQVTTIPVGSVTMFAGPNVPPEWLLCDGRAVSRTTYAVLYAAIGTTWGNGNGTSTFNLPTMTGSRYMRGNESPGSMGGSNTHAHPGTDWRTGATNAAPDGTSSTDAAPNGTGSGNGAPDGTGSAGSHDHNVASGGGHDHSIGSSSHSHGSGSASSLSTVPGASGIKTIALGNHGHNIGSDSHSHGGSTGSGGGHDHGRTGENGGHSHTVPNSSHSHGVPGSNHSHSVPNSTHDHNVPASTTESSQPLFSAFVPIIFAGV